MLSFQEVQLFGATTRKNGAANLFSSLLHLLLKMPTDLRTPQPQDDAHKILSASVGCFGFVCVCVLNNHDIIQYPPPTTQ